MRNNGKVINDGANEKTKIDDGVVVEDVPLWQIFVKVSKFSTPFALSRMSVGILGIANAIVVMKIGNNAVVAWPLISTLMTSTMSLTRNSLGSTSIVIGKIDNNLHRAEIASVVNTSLVLGSIMAGPLAAVLGTSQYWMQLLNVPSAITDELGRYFLPFLMGIPPIMWYATDQQFALGINRPLIPFAASVAYVALSMVIGYPLALGLWHPLPDGLAGLAWGNTISNWICFFCLRAYYFLNKDISKTYNIFSTEFKDFYSILKRLLRIGVPGGIQSFLEWLNLAIISFMCDLQNQNVVLAEEAALQPLIFFNLILQSSAQSVAVITGRELSKKLSDEDYLTEKSIVLRNSKKLVLAADAIFLGISSIVCGAFIIFPKQLTEIFVDSDTPSFDEILILAQSFFIINGIGTLFDTINTVHMGALRGKDDVFIPVLINALFTLVLGLSAGGLATFLLDWGADWLFITRDIGIILSAFTMALRWYLKSKILTTKVEVFPPIAQHQDTFAFVEQNKIQRPSQCASVVNYLSCGLLARNKSRVGYEQVVSMEDSIHFQN